MLARNAESLYWIGRYVERADDTARILDVTVHQLLEDSSVDPDQASRTLLKVLGIESPKQQLDVWSLTDVVAFSRDTEGGNSIVEAISAAHPTMPMPSYARVTNLNTRKSLIVRVNDRGPYHANREIDLSAKAADLLGFRGHGIARVRVEYVGPAPLQGTDDRILAATLREGLPAPAPPSVMIASNRFLPNFGRAPSSYGAPLPQERPYDLGERDGRVASAPVYPQSRIADADARSLASEALARQRTNPRLVDQRIADISPDTEPPLFAPRLRSAEAVPLPRGGPSGGPWAPPTSQPVVSPVTAYAPVNDVSRAISSGRGLY